MLQMTSMRIDQSFDNGDTKMKNFQETLSEVEIETNEDDRTWSSLAKCSYTFT